MIMRLIWGRDLIDDEKEVGKGAAREGAAL